MEKRNNKIRPKERCSFFYVEMLFETKYSLDF